MNLSFKNPILVFSLLFFNFIYSQVGIGTSTPDVSAALDVTSSSNDKGVLLPRLTQSQRTAISTPANGLLVYQTDGTSGLYYYDGSNWIRFGDVQTVNGVSPSLSNGNVPLTFLATQTGTQAQRAATASPADGLVHIVTGDPTPSENNKVYIYSTGLSTWTLSSGFTDTDEQDISGSSFTDSTSTLIIDIEDGSGQTLILSALEELITDSDPATNLLSASIGDLAYDTTDDSLQAYDGANWIDVGSAQATPTLDAVTDVGSTTTNGITIGGLTIGTGGTAYTLPTATSTSGSYLTVSTTTNQLAFITPPTTVTPTLDEVTDVGSTTTNGITIGGLTIGTGGTAYTLPTATSTSGSYLTVSTTTNQLAFITPPTTVTPTLDEVTDVGSTTTNGITIGGLTIGTGGTAYTLPTATSTSGSYLTVSTTTNQLAFITPPTTVTPTLDEVTDVGSTTTNGITIGGLTIGTGGTAYTLPTATSTSGSYLTVSTTTNELVFTTTVTPTLDAVTDVGSTTTNGITIGGLTIGTGGTAYTLPTATSTSGSYLTVSTTTNELVFTTTATPTLDEVTDVGSTTTNGITIGGLTIGTGGTAYTLPTATSTSGSYLTVSTTTNELVFTTTVTPTLDEVTDVGSTTTNGIDVGSLTISSAYTLPLASVPIGPGFYMTVSTTATDTLVFTQSPLPEGTADGDVLHWNPLGNWERTNEFIIPFSSGAIDSNRSIVPRSDNSFDLGSSSLNFNAVNTLNLRSNASMTVSSSGILTLNSSATGTPTISLQQGGTEIAGIGSSTFFIGDSSSGNHYFFPSQGSTIGSTATGSPTVLAFTSTNTLEVFSISNLEQDTLDSVSKRGAITNEPLYINTMTVSTSIDVMTDASLGTGSSTNSDITIGNDGGDDLFINAVLSSNLGFDRDDRHDIGTLAWNARNVYSRSLIANNDLSINVSSTTDDQILFQQSGTTLAGVNSSTFYIGRDSNRYEFPQIAPATVNNQVLAYTVTNSLAFTTIPSLPIGTSTGTVLRYNPSSTNWEETGILKINPGGTFANNITLSNTLVPLIDDSIDLGKTSYEFSNVFTQKIETAEADIEFSISNETLYLQLDSKDNLTFNSELLSHLGNNNIAFGLRTLRSINSQLNTAFGNDALTQSNLSGEKNTAIGYKTMEDTIDGQENTAIGHNALSNNVSGDTNLAIGTNSGSLIRESKNVVIGSSADVGSISVENAIAIGYNAKVLQSNSIQLGTGSTTLLNTSAVVSATGFNTTGTATLTTLTVGDTSKYTLPTTRGTAGQVLTVSTTTSQLVFASTTNSPYYILAEANDGQVIDSAGENVQFPVPYLDSNNGITIGSDIETFNLPAGKIYKCVGYVDIDLAVAKETSVTTQFYDGSTAVGVQGVYRLLEDNDGDASTKFYTAGAGPATAIIDATSSSKNITFKVVTRTQDFSIEGPGSYVLIEEL